MECRRRAKSLIVLTLLQLCRAEIKDTQPQWYSANIINDGFQPKSISEMFPTEAAFSTANPIIVLSNSDNDIRPSTLAPPSSYTSSLSSSTTFKTSTTMFPSSSQSSQFSSFSPSSSPSSQPPIEYNIEQNRPFQPNQPLHAIQQQTSPAVFEIQPIQPLQKLVLGLENQPQRVQIQQEKPTSIQNLPQNPLIVKHTPSYQAQPTEVTMPQDMPLELVAQNDERSTGAQSATTRSLQTISPQPNFILLYPQTPQQIQSFPDLSSSPRTTLTEASFTTSAIPPTVSSTISSYSPFSTVSSLSTSPFLSTTQSLSTQNLLTSTSPSVTVTPLSTIGSSNTASSGSNSIFTNVTPRSTTPFPIAGRPLQIDQLFPIKIRVVAPSGSITNVNINQRPANAQIPQKSTQRYIVTPKVTTRKPTTRRTQKPRKNTYERCLQGCRKNGQTLCAAPLSQFPVDPKTLRGFPSVCHMACHNSYRKDAYEKVIDGSCSKLRTRIRPIDSNTKLKKEELHKVQYFIANADQEPILEISGAYS